MTTVLKIAIGGTIGAGAVGGSVGLAYVLNQPKNLKEELERDNGFELLNTSSKTDNKDDPSWKKLAEEHSKTPSKAGITKINELTIAVHSASDTAHPGIKQLKERCELLFKKTKSEKDYEQAKKDAKNWCNKKSPLLSN